MKYQPEIDGLRAISVLSVLFYHLGAGWIPGGFTGVDIFFVISGFLITGIIRKDILLGRFSFVTFYARRIRRIFPALMAILLMTAIAGYFFLDPGDYEAQGQSAVAAALSLANLYFFYNTGYFDNAAETLPLLHTWSLGVEEQFYIVLPIVLVVLSATRLRRWILLILAVSAAGFFCWSMWLVAVDQKAAFYLTHLRAWELGAGALLAYLPSARANVPRWCTAALPVIGIGLICFSIFSHHPLGTFPGKGALPAVAGAVLILAFVGESNLVNRALSLRPGVFVGRISYSLYLWHWPLIVYWRHHTHGSPMPLSEQLVLGIASVVLGYTSWRWIETPLRHSTASNWRTILMGTGGMVLASLPSMMVVSNEGFPARIPEDYQAMQSKDAMWRWECPDKLSLQGQFVCSVGAPWRDSRNKAFIIGDSHAQHMMPLAHEAGLKTGTSVANIGGSCPPLFRREADGLRHYDATFTERCFESRDALFRMLSDNPEVKNVIVAGLWPMLGYSVYKTSAERDEIAKSMQSDGVSARRIPFARGKEYIRREIELLAAELKKRDVTLTLISDTPTFQRDPIPCVMARSSVLLRRHCPNDDEFVKRADMEAFQLPMAELIKKIGTKDKSIRIVIPTDELCSGEYCDAYVHGNYIYRDADHLRRNMPKEVYATLSERIGLTSALKSVAALQGAGPGAL